MQTFAFAGSDDLFAPLRTPARLISLKELCSRRARRGVNRVSAYIYRLFKLHRTLKEKFFIFGTANVYGKIIMVIILIVIYIASCIKSFTPIDHFH